MSQLQQRLFGAEGISACFSDQALIAAMLQFEAGLALAEAETGVIDASAARAIAGACDTANFEPDALGQEARAAGTLAIPFVKNLTAQVAARDAAAARYVHWGATSQDVVDTALVLQIKRAGALLRADLIKLGDAVAKLAHDHQFTPMAGRTLLQVATPISFGWKASTWLTRRKCSRLRVREVSQVAAFQPKVIGVAACSRVRPAIGVSRWRSASTATALPRRTSAASSKVAARPSCSTSAVSTTSWLVAPQCT